MSNDLETANMRRVVKVNTSPEKLSKNRPRIVFGYDETNEQRIDEEHKCELNNEKK